MKAKTAETARGKWKGILQELGVNKSYLTGKHGPCPMCGGVDRFRWDNRGDDGCYICGQCGAGNGFSLLMGLNGWDFATAARRVDEVAGDVDAEPIVRGTDPRARAEMLNRLWVASHPIKAGDPAYAYLAGRVQLPGTMPECLRFAPRCPSPDGIKRTALVALVQGADGESANIHRTFLGPNGKAEMDNPRAMMPGAIPEGSAVRLFPVHEECLGIAEGIETAFAAAAKFDVPVWSAINATMLTKWVPPPNVREVWVFGDNDAKFGGQAAAFSLAHKLTARCGLRVQVRLPGEIGHDWVDAQPVAQASARDTGHQSCVAERGAAYAKAE
jgi:putative DNA primase/helicase